jgi:hypothetical protein
MRNLSTPSASLGGLRALTSDAAERGGESAVERSHRALRRVDVGSPAQAIDCGRQRTAGARDGCDRRDAGAFNARCSCAQYGGFSFV